MVKTKPVQVKICGITNEEDAVWAVNLGADFIGLNFYGESPRKVSLEKAHEIASKVPPFVKCAGIFVDQSFVEIEKVLKKVPLQVIQLHGSEKKEDLEKIKSQCRVQIWKAIRVENEGSLNQIQEFAGLADAVLLDAWKGGQAGGTGETFDWDLAVKAKAFGIPIFLAGGLNPENVGEAISRTDPKGVDAASGVEKNGHPRKKDMEKMKSFIMTAKGL